MKWLSPRISPNHTALAMIGAKAGERVLVMGRHAEHLAAELALSTGLNGRTLVVDAATDARTRVEAAAEAAGALVEFDVAPASTLPLESGSFDAVVLHRQLSDASGGAILDVTREARRVLRPGGRLIAIEPGMPRGPLSRWLAGRPDLQPEQVMDVLTRAGFGAVRRLADTEGVMYVEALNPRR
jgi:ubiquinone/menaquinone biosynthesis C-methylase UbiE